MDEERAGDPKEPSDEVLMADYQTGELSAFDVLYRRYENRIYGYLLRLTGDPETAADLFQETFLRLHRSRERYNPDRPFSTWIFTIATNLVKTEFTRRSSRTTVEAETDVEQLGGGTPADARVHKAELESRVQEALIGLSQEQRQVLLLAKFEGLSYQEIAVITGKTTAAVKQMAYRALQSLKSALKDLES